MKKLMKPYFILPFVALVIALLILFIPPYPGVSDHGDFHRIMSSCGLSENYEMYKTGKSGFVQTIYDYAKLSIGSILQVHPSSSIIYPIILSRMICKVIGMPYFSTHVLSIILVLLYIFAFMIFVYTMYKISHALSWLTGILGIFILFDAGYIVWANSLYQEAVMFIGFFLMLSIAFYIMVKKPKLNMLQVLIFLLATLFFMLSKAQVISLLPISLVLFGVLCIKYANSKAVRIFIGFGLCIIVFYTSMFYMDQRLSQGKCTIYDTIFYGILMDSPNPAQDLNELHLTPGLIADVGKHAFLPAESYYCPPDSEMADELIYNKVSTFDVVLFYLKHPDRFYNAMQYTARNAFQTTNFLGKFEKYQVGEYTERIGRFTIYSDLRAKFTKKFILQLLLCIFLVLLSVAAYVKIKKRNLRILIGLFWITVGVCCLQYPLPVRGNGHADTLKQLFLFNYSFDLGVILFAGILFTGILQLRKTKQ